MGSPKGVLAKSVYLRFRLRRRKVRSGQASAGRLPFTPLLLLSHPKLLTLGFGRGPVSATPLLVLFPKNTIALGVPWGPGRDAYDAARKT